MVKDKWCLAPETCPLRLSSDPFDSHDDRDDDGEGESVEEHKSVIMHLLSQVRLGMDLTKVKTSLTSMLSYEPGSLMLDSSLVVSLCSVWIYLTAVVLSFYSLTSSVQAVSFKQPTQLQFYIFFLYYILQVVLPTFILERRSLLEMYADFFAHPDLFVR